jgi:hypothetical protein
VARYVDLRKDSDTTLMGVGYNIAHIVERIDGTGVKRAFRRKLRVDAWGARRE